MLYTIGHSNLAIEDFLGLLERNAIEAIADVRRFPGSRKHPHFAREHLEATLTERGIVYRWFESLGGRRKKSSDESLNAGLRHPSFRNYADYMRTSEFREAMRELLEFASQRRTAIMCAESVFWRCHRRLISDWCLANDVPVEHIFPNGDAKPHAATKEAVFADGGVTYPEEPPSE